MMTAKSSSDKCSSLFYCEEQGCVLAFRTYQEVQLHMDTGIHSTEQEKESSFDVIRKKWAVKVGDLQTIRETHASTSASEDLPTASDDLHIPSAQCKSVVSAFWSFCRRSHFMLKIPLVF